MVSCVCNEFPLGNLPVSQADNEGSIPFTRSTIFKASSLPSYSKVSVKVSVIVFTRQARAETDTSVICRPPPTSDRAWP